MSQDQRSDGDEHEVDRSAGTDAPVGDEAPDQGAAATAGSEAGPDAGESAPVGSTHEELGDDELGPEWGASHGPEHGADETETSGAVAGEDPRPTDAADITGDAADTTGDAGTAPRRRWPRRVLVGALLGLGALYLAGYALTGTRMPANATVAGIDVGAMSPSEARSVVDAELGPRVDDPVRLVHTGDDEESTQQFEIDPAEAGLTFDLDRTIDEAGGTRSWDPRDMLALFFGSRDHAPALDVDQGDLDSAVERIGEAVDVDVVEPLITFPDAEPEAREPEAGLEVDREEAPGTIRAAYLVQTEPQEVPTRVVEPTVDEDGLAEAMTTIAEPAVSGPVVIEVGDEDSVELPVTAFAPALTVEVRDGRMAPRIDPDALAEPLQDSTTGIGEQAVDATIDIVGGEPVITPSQEGVGLQPGEMAEKLVPVLTETGDARAVQIEATVVEPEFTTEDAEALGVVERVSEFETYYPHADYRNINQGRAAELIDGTLVKPGETFSFNDTVGQRTEAAGFTSGAVISGGRFRDELGGGVSQVVTTTYNAAFFAGMDDVEHHPHAFYIDRYPVGREATVYFGSLDLRFRNSTDHGVLIKASINPSTPGTRGTMRVEMWSTKVWDIQAGASERRNFRNPGTRYDDSSTCTPQSPIQGFDIDIYRTFRQNGETVKSETVTANYQAADRVICGSPPDEDDEDDD